MRRNLRRARDWLRRARLKYVLDRWAQSHADVALVQIGSHNGRSNDPLTRHIDRQSGWHGIMVEPMPHLYEQLVALRGGEERFRLVRAAVTETPGTVTMITVDTIAAMPAWTDQLSSLDRGVILKHEAEVPGLRDHLRAVEVPAMTFEQLVEMLPRLDLLHIDAEGHDAAILAQVDLRRWRPGAVLFEHKHLSNADWVRCRTQLESHGYRLTWSNADTLGVRRDG